MSSQEFSIDIVSAPDRDDLYAELRFGEEQWGEMTVDVQSKSFAVKVYPSSSGRPHVFDLLGLIDILEKARENLRRIEGI